MICGGNRQQYAGRFFVGPASLAVLFSGFIFLLESLFSYVIEGCGFRPDKTA
jgi:hypothetical protein